MIFVLTMAGLAAIWLSVWMRFRDPFHPLIFILPQLLFLYGWMPFSIWRDDSARFMFFAGDTFLYTYHAIMMALTLTLLLGVGGATRGATQATARWHQLELVSPQRIRTLGLCVGFIGAAAYLYTIWNVGGFAVAYGSAYGSGWGAGYILELRFIGLIGALLIFMVRVGRGMRPADWAIVVLCIAPTLTQGLLGARRGPTFLALVVLAGGYLFFMRKRVPLIAIVMSGAALGMAMLFLVANRGSIYLGSDFEDFKNPLEFLATWNANEYLIGSGVLRYAFADGSFYGMREFIHLTARLVPASVWPTIYSDLPAMLGVEVNLWQNSGMNPDRMSEIIGWTPSVGSAEGFGASLWMEFGIFAFAISYGIGYLYGRVWLMSRESITARATYLLLAALSIYLVMQNFDPFIYRAILYGGPTYLMARAIQVRRTPRIGRHSARRQGLRYRPA